MEILDLFNLSNWQTKDMKHVHRETEIERSRDRVRISHLSFAPNRMDSPRVSPEALSTALYEISIRASNSVLEALSRTPLWNDIAEASRDQNWWYRRTEYLVGRELTYRLGDWSRVYTSLKMYGLEFNRYQDYGSTLLIQVLFEIEADPSLLISDMLEAEDMLDAAASLATREGFALILADPRVDPRMRGNGCLIVAITSGNIPVLQLLLEDGRVDPSEDRNEAIRTAVEEGDTEATRLLLSDKRVNASDEHNEAIHTAAKYGFVDIFELLLFDKNVQRYEESSTIDPFGFEPAILGGHIEIVRLISENQTNHLETIINWGLVLASKVGNLEIVKLLLEHEEINNSRVDDAISLATKRKHWEIVKLIRSRFPE